MSIHHHLFLPCPLFFSFYSSFTFFFSSLAFTCVVIEAKGKSSRCCGPQGRSILQFLYLLLLPLAINGFVCKAD